MSKPSKHGYTLIELLITVAIIGVLAAIALPQFTFYRSKAKSSEVKTILGNILLCENTFYASYDNYANVPIMNPNVVQPNVYRRPWENRPCPPLCSRLTPAACTEFACFGVAPTGTLLYSYAARAFGAPSQIEFALGALGDNDGDLVQGSYSIQSANAGGSAVGLNTDGISACLVGIPKDELVDCRPGAF